MSHETILKTLRDQEGRRLGYLDVCRNCDWTRETSDRLVAEHLAREHERMQTTADYLASKMVTAKRYNIWIQLEEVSLDADGNEVEYEDISVNVLMFGRSASFDRIEDAIAFAEALDQVKWSPIDGAVVAIRPPT